ncbi:MAG: hypothetical protein IPL38_03370 [Rhodobacter sp.]|jgi:hypothetical protein|nr:hypothetical protein [Rhodobacter sp.]MBK8438572.1 hypothetical protein [Rhodobacter sp.]
MKKSLALAAALSLSASVAFAGGPIVIQDEGEPEVIVQKPRSGAALPILLGVLVFAAVAGGNGT